MISILHVEPFENRGDEGLLGKTDAGTVCNEVNVYAEEWGFRAEIGDLALFGQPGLNFDCSFGSVLWVQH
jgi:hypothetical protein